MILWPNNKPVMQFLAKKTYLDNNNSHPRIKLSSKISENAQYQRKNSTKQSFN